MQHGAILEAIGVTKRFGGITALAGVSLVIRRGELVGLIGPNGAGKTTLFNVLAGVYLPDDGSVRFQREEIIGLRPHVRCRMGLARTFQLTKPFLGLTLLENVTVGAYYGPGGRRPALAEAGVSAEEVLRLVGLGAKRDHLAATLTVGERKRLELARAVATQPMVLLLDEVVAGLSPAEVGEMMEIIRSIWSRGVSILMVEHVMRAVMGVSQRIIVLHQGQVLAEGSPAEISENAEVVAAYLGTADSSTGRLP
ncbi:MAG: ABC transporter ATP-binding protein [Candidatus Methylomirabilia bacterium]